ncbi:MAG: efflux RND transporter permease subunit [Fusobacterium sp.]
MTLTSLSLKHIYTTLAITIAIIFLGISSFFSMKTELNPNVDPIVVSVFTTYKGVSASDIGTLINEPLEEKLGIIEGVKKITSKAMEGKSIVTTEFNYDKNIDVAAVEIQNIINLVRDQLQPDIDEPQIKKISSDDTPILTVSVSGNLSLEKIRTFADNEISDRLQLVKGVASVDVFGGKKREIEISIDKDKLAAFNISMGDVVSKLNNENVVVPGGKITRANSEFLIRTPGQYDALKPLEKIVIGSSLDGLIYLNEVGEIKDHYEDQRGSFYTMGKKEGVAINIIKQRDANTIEVVKKVKAQLKFLREEYPQINFVIVDDQSTLIKLVVNNLAGSILQGIILTIFIIFLFLNKWRNTLAVCISIPITFVFTLTLMSLAGLTLNSTTMAALLLSVGMLVDDSILVIENITRHFEDLGKSPLKASIEGANEVGVSNFSGSLTSMIVVFPVMFAGGFVQKLFRPISMTLFFAWTGSLLASLTVIPIVMSLILKSNNKKKEFKIFNGINRIGKKFIEILDKSRDGYIKCLKIALEYRAVVIAAGIGLLIISLNLMPLIGMEMVPVMDSGQIYISMEAEPGSSLEKTSWITKQVEKTLDKISEIEIYSSQIGTDTGSVTSSITGASGVQQSYISIILSSRNKRKRSIWDIEKEIRLGISKIPGLRSSVVRELGSTAISTTKAPILIKLSGENPKVLEYIARELMPKLQLVPGAENITTSWTSENPELHIDMDRIKIASLGLSTKEVGRQVMAAVEGTELSKYMKVANKKDIPINIRYKENSRLTIENIKDIQIINSKGNRFLLGELAVIKMKKGPNLVTRENFTNVLEILGYTRGRAFSKVTGDIDKIIKNYQAPEGYSVVLSGEKDDMKESLQRLLIGLVIAIVFVYLILVSQFKSFLHPFTIMLAIPLEIIGVVVGLLVGRKYISMPTMLGIILLTGIVVNDSIHLLDFAIEERKKGKNSKKAILKAAHLRYRAIIMTTVSTIAGMIPLALELAVGSEKYSSLAIAIIGGLTSSTLLLLFVVPVVYTFFEEIKDERREKNR